MEILLPWSGLFVCENVAKIGFLNFSSLLAFLPFDLSPHEFHLTLPPPSSLFKLTICLELGLDLSNS